VASEYVFFDESLSRRFAQFARDQGLAAGVHVDEMDNYVVALPDEVDDDLDDRLEAEYDALMDEQRSLIEADEGDEARHLMGVTVTLPDGNARLVRLPADYGQRLCQHFSPQEIHDIVSAIARELADPVSGPLCRNAG
jgi:response regulator RpfG family c-di-GMP phosphodiesterase